MSRFSPETILSNRYKIICSLPADQSIERYRALDQNTGLELEVVTPTARDILNTTLRTTFLETHGNNQKERAGHLSCTDVFSEGSVPVAVYPAIRGQLAKDNSLSPEQAQQLIGFLTPLLSELKEPLRYSNLVVTEQNELLYRPRGYTGQGNKILGHPLVDPLENRGSAFALSMIVYGAICGLPEWKKKQEQEIWLSQPISLQKESPEVSKELEEIFQLLLSGQTPNVPASGSVQLTIPKELPEQAQPSQTKPVVNQTEQLQRTASRARVDVPYPKWVIFLSPPVGEKNMRVLAAILQLDPHRLTRELEDGAVPIGGSSSKAETETLMKELSDLGLRVEMRSGAPIKPSVLMLGMLGTLAGIGLWSTNMLLGLAIIAVANTIEITALLSGMKQSRRFKELQAIKQTSPLNAALQKVRSEIFKSTLPQLAKSDYYEMVDEIEELGKDPEQERQCLELIAQIDPVMEQESTASTQTKSADELKHKLQKLQHMSRVLE